MIGTLQKRSTSELQKLQYGFRLEVEEKRAGRWAIVSMAVFMKRSDPHIHPWRDLP